MAAISWGGIIDFMEKIFKHVKISGIASALPKEIFDLSSLSESYGANEVAKIIKATGIERVHLAPEGKTTSDYCVAAAEALIPKIGMSKDDIDGIVFVTETPDYIVPHTSAIIQDRLGLSHWTIAFDINYGCAGYVYGIFQACMLVESGYCKNVLLCAGDTLSRYVNPRDRALRMVLGDAGTATIVSRSEKEEQDTAFSFFTDGAGAKHLIIPAGGQRIWRHKGVTDIVKEDADGNARSQENIFMDGLEIMEFTLHEVKKLIDETLAMVNWQRNDVDLYALHQANKLIVNYIVRQLKVDKNKVPVSVKNTGNTSSGTIPLMICNTFSNVNDDLKKVIICGFGTGLSCAAGAIDLHEAYINPTFEV